MTAGETLILEATDFIDTQHWRCVLEDSQGKFLADQEVRLDLADPNYSAFIDLEGFLKVNFSSRGEKYPDREPCPAVLILGFVSGRQCHAVVACCRDHLRIITVYWPDEERWINHCLRKNE